MTDIQGRRAEEGTPDIGPAVTRSRVCSPRATAAWNLLGEVKSPPPPT